MVNHDTMRGSMADTDVGRLVVETQRELGLDSDAPAVPLNDARRLAEECGDDTQRLRRYLKRRLLGEPTPYVLGYQEFRGRRYRVDRRVYITDPEATHLIDAVAVRIDELARERSGRLLIAELGTGCGSLGIALKLERPEINLVAMDIDGSALNVARENMHDYGVEITLVESDLFASWPFNRAPDLIFGDPPWGDHTSIYDEDRPIEYYLAMPNLSVFPPGGVTGLHEQILQDIGRLGWDSEIMLNCGILDLERVERLAAMTRRHTLIEPVGGIRILHAVM